MQEEEKPSTEITLASPVGSPYHFKISIVQSADNSGLAFTVEGHNADKTGLTKTQSYLLKNHDHSSYIDLFDELAKDFGLRVPQNRLPEVPRTFNAPYHELLTNNLTPQMLYGYGDPAVLRVEEEDSLWYYLVVTSNDAPDSFPICRSADLEHWEFAGFVFARGNKPAWAVDGELISDYWAPEMHRVGGEFRIYFVARSKDTLELCIGVARSAKPGGPYVADREPILKGDKIDPHVFVEDEDNAFLYWKQDNNAIWPTELVTILCKSPGLITQLFNKKEDQLTASFITTLQPWTATLKPMEAFFVQQNLIEAVTERFIDFKEKLRHIAGNEAPHLQQEILTLLAMMRTPIYAQKLSQNGSELYGEKILIMENDLPWEAHLVEGPWVTKQGNNFYLFYSGNDFSTDQYGIGVAISDSALGPFKKMDEPILKSTEKWWAPGHPSVATGPDGNPYLFLHAYFPNQAGYKKFRALLSVGLIFEDDKVMLC